VAIEELKRISAAESADAWSHPPEGAERVALAHLVRFLNVTLDQARAGGPEPTTRDRGREVLARHGMTLTDAPTRDHRNDRF